MCEGTTRAITSGFQFRPTQLGLLWMDVPKRQLAIPEGDSDSLRKLLILQARFGLLISQDVAESPCLLTKCGTRETNEKSTKRK